MILETHPFIFAGLPLIQQHYVQYGVKLHEPNEIINATCMVLDLKYEDVVSKKRQREFVLARQIAMTLIAFANPLLSLKSIGNMFGGRDHSTVIYSKEQYNDLYGRDKLFTLTANKVKELTNN